MPIVVHLEGVAQIRDRLGRFSRRINIEAESILQGLAYETLDDAQQAAPRDLGAGISNMYVEGDGLHFAVVTPDDYMVVQEYGRAPGQTAPSTAHVAGWGARHGFVSKQAVFALAQSIGRRGFRGKYFMTHAAQKAQAKIRSSLAAGAAAVERAWYGY